MKYSKWIGMASCILLIAVCFMPWTYHADVQKNFTGFFSQNDAYGTPGKYFVFFSVLIFVLIFLQKTWAQRVHLFVAGIMVAYAVKTYILYTSCYNAYCPEKKLGIFLVVSFSVIIFASSLFSDIKIPHTKKAQ
jgi:hypothetical protein